MLAPAIRLYRHSFSGLSRDIWLLSLVMLVNRAGTMVIPFLTIYLTGQKGFRLEEAGWVMSSFGLGSVLGAFIGGKLTDRIGYYPVQFWSLALGGFCFLGLQFVNGVAAMCAATFILSTIADAFRPANQTAVAFHSRPENRSRAFALVRLAVNLGFSAGPGMGGVIGRA
ncbi:MAG TPA: MFS transporter, partial [Flavilitoribacter sp.]|nr:MFS transporter [Flavilitoribacter sp.]